jgi:hypothetical protein
MAADRKDDVASRAAEVKETEDLLAGFDRPGRPGRARTPSQRDFVDYHLDRQRSSDPDLRGRPSQEPPPSAGRERRQLPTAIIPRTERRFPTWVPWAALLLVMSIGGVLVAAAVASPSPTSSLPPEAPTPTPTPIPTPLPFEPPAPILAPDEEPSSVASASASASPAPVAPSAFAPRRAPSATASAPEPRPSGAPPPPSDDFIRHL